MIPYFVKVVRLKYTIEDDYDMHVNAWLLY